MLFTILGDPAVASLRGIHVVIHEVRAGETLDSLLQRYRTTRGTLESLNSAVDFANLKPGTRIRILSRPGVFHRVQAGLTLSDIADAYERSQADLMKANGISRAKHITAGMEIFVPDAGPLSRRKLSRMKKRATARVQARRRPASSFGKPLATRRRLVISDGFGYRFHPITRRRQKHLGIDVIAAWGTPVVAAKAGVVKFAGWRGGYGKLVVIDHGKGYETYYGHLTDIAVAKGTRVAEGQKIGRLGATGDVTAPHLHFEIRRWGVPKNPVKYIRPR